MALLKAFALMFRMRRGVLFVVILGHALNLLSIPFVVSDISSTESTMKLLPIWCKP